MGRPLRLRPRLSSRRFGGGFVTPGVSARSTDRVLDDARHQPYMNEWMVGGRRQLPGLVTVDATALAGGAVAAPIAVSRAAWAPSTCVPCSEIAWAQHSQVEPV